MSRSLPSRPDLRWLRDEARARRRRGEFGSLALAQLAIAREHGFASWPRLKAQVDALRMGRAERAAILIASACSGDPRRAVTILELDPAVARHDLATACAAGEADEVAGRLLTGRGQAGEPTGPNGWQPLSYACFSRLPRIDARRAAGIRAVVAALLDAGADPNASFMDGDWSQTAIYGAAGIAGDPELTEMLLRAGADPNDAGPDHTVGEALYHACEQPDPTCARLLIDAGTDPGVARYCLGRVLDFDNPAMVAMFCSHGVRPSAAHLHQALWRRRPPETIAALLHAGAPADERDEHGLTPVQIALLMPDHDPVVDLLHEHGAALPARGEGLAALALGAPATPPPALLDELVIVGAQQGDREWVRSLLDIGARADGDPDTENAPLGEACWRARASVVELLLARGAATEFRGGGCAIGAALHGSRHCQHPEGGPTMATTAEIDPTPYLDITRMLLTAGARVPERIGGDRGPRALALLAELGISPEELTDR